MENLIVIANLGRVRPVKFREAGNDPREKAHLVEIAGSTVEMRPKPISALVTDQAGRATQSGPVDRKGGMSYGEEHNLKSELDKQALERIAAAVGKIVASEGNPPWRLVAPCQRPSPSKCWHPSVMCRETLPRVTAPMRQRRRLPR